MNEHNRPKPELSSSVEERGRAKPSTSRSAVYATSSGTILVRPKAERKFDQAYLRAFIQDALSFLRYDSPDLLP
jgi:hypothetical protein